MKASLLAAATLLLLSSACLGAGNREVAANFPDPEVQRFMSCVAESDAQSVARCRIDPGSLNRPGRDGDVPLTWLLAHDGISPELTAALVRMGADPFAGDETPASYAIRHRSIAYLEALIAAGMDVNGRGGGLDATPLFSAVLADDYDKVELLIRHGANLEARNSPGDTPLLFADIHQYEIQMLLLRAGADPRAVDSVGNGICWALENIPHHVTAENIESEYREGVQRDLDGRNRFIEMLGARGIRCGLRTG